VMGYALVDELAADAGFSNPTDRDEFSWSAQTNATLYEVVRAETADFSTTCTYFSTANSYYSDPNQPDPGVVYHYLVRALSPNAGSWGWNSAGIERVLSCP